MPTISISASRCLVLQIAAWPFLFCMLLIAKGIGTETIAGQVIGFTRVGALGLAILSLLIDPFLIPSRIRAHSDRMRAQLEVEADWQAA